ncbi:MULTISPECIES: hypothetical protein [unclassified Ligilactobacillus]|uniref:hypothetical protein n=1 Tax=unclassified Ligilactobacillus TaxID=2767920 RepID=UPI00385219DE
MDIARMARLAYQSEVQSVLPVRHPSENERWASGMVAVNVALANLMPLVRQQEKLADQLLATYCEALRAFLEIANDKQWTSFLFIDDQQLAAFQEKWTNRSDNAVYLIMQQQLNKSYFEHRYQPFVRAWHVFLKFGFSRLRLDPVTVEVQYVTMFS